MSRFSRIVLLFDLLVVALLGYFFLDGLQYAPQAVYFETWLIVLGIPISLLAAALAFARRERPGLATALLLVLAIPPVAYVLFFGILLAVTPRWN